MQREIHQQNSKTAHRSTPAATPLPDPAPLFGGPHAAESIANAKAPELQYVNDWDAPLFNQTAKGSLADLANTHMKDKFGTNRTPYDNEKR